MFKFLHQYFYNIKDLPSVIFKLNLWSYINVKVFKVKITQTLVFFISGLMSLQQKYIRVFHKAFNFDSFFYTYLFLNVFFIVIFFIV